MKPVHSAWLVWMCPAMTCRPRFYTSIYESWGPHYPNFQQSFVNGCCVLDTAKDLDTTPHYALLYKLTKREFSTSLIMLTAAFLTDRKFFVEGKCSALREIVAEVPQGHILAPILYSLHINKAPWHQEFILLCLWATDKHVCHEECHLLGCDSVWHL
jgi:hypothetical protein